MQIFLSCDTLETHDNEFPHDPIFSNDIPIKNFLMSLQEQFDSLKLRIISSPYRCARELAAQVSEEFNYSRAVEINPKLSKGLILTKSNFSGLVEYGHGPVNKDYVDSSTSDYHPLIELDDNEFKSRIDLFRQQYFKLFNNSEVTIVVTHFEVIDELFDEFSVGTIWHHIVRSSPSPTDFNLRYSGGGRGYGWPIKGKYLELYNWMRKNTNIQFSMSPANRNPIPVLRTISPKEYSYNFKRYIVLVEFGLTDPRRMSYLSSLRYRFNFDKRKNDNGCGYDTLYLDKDTIKMMKYIKMMVLIFDEDLWQKIRLLLLIEQLPNEIIQMMKNSLVTYLLS